MRSLFLFLAIAAALSGLNCATPAAPRAAAAPAAGPRADPLIAAHAERLTSFLKGRLALALEQERQTRELAIRLFERNSRLAASAKDNPRIHVDRVRESFAAFDRELDSVLAAEQRLKYASLRREFLERARGAPWSGRPRPYN